MQGSGSSHETDLKDDQILQVCLIAMYCMNRSTGAAIPMDTHGPTKLVIRVPEEGW